METTFAIILSGIIGYCFGWLRGHFVGKADQQASSERTATKEARRRALIPAEDY